MLEYLTILLVFSLILTAILNLLQKYIPLSPRIIYGTVGISFILGAFFPVTITALSPIVVMAAYFGLIVIIAVALGYAESRIDLSTSSATLGDNILEPENSAEIPVDDYDLSEKETGYSEACAAQEQDISAAVPEEETADSPVHMTANEHRDDEIGTEISTVEQNLPYTEYPGEAISEEVISIEENIPTEEEEPPTVPELSSDKTEQVAAEPVSPPEMAAAESEDTYRDGDQPSHVEKNEEPGEDIIDQTASPVTINDFISAGFKARASGDLIGAVKYFMAAFQMNREQHISTTLALEICTVYQELGQYFQAVLILKSVIEQKNFINDPDLRQKINERLIYLEILAELLRITKMPHAPYSKIPDIIKIKANLKKDKKLIGLNQGGGIN